MSTGKALLKFLSAPALALGLIFTVLAFGPPAHAAADRHHRHASYQETNWWEQNPGQLPEGDQPSSALIPATPASTPTSPPPVTTAPGSASAPLPAALAKGHPLVKTFSPATLTSSAWVTPSNDPGNCGSPNKSAKLNAKGYAEIDTTGAAGDCVSLQSPGTLPVKAGYVYEAMINFSSFNDWPALWMYSPDWPAQGEIDAVEGGPGISSATWHQAGNLTIGPDAWDQQLVPHGGAPDIKAGTWTTVDISFTAAGVDVYYQGKLYVHIPESVTAGSDPMYLTVSEGSCDADGGNVCNGGSSPAGSVQVKSIREFS